jgi:hypothetical protein
VELIDGRHRYRLVRRYLPAHGGGKDVIGEVDSVGALAALLRSRTPLTLADLREG